VMKDGQRGDQFAQVPLQSSADRLLDGLPGRTKPDITVADPLQCPLKYIIVFTNEVVSRWTNEPQLTSENASR
jgi:hypothetical protein